MKIIAHSEVPKDPTYSHLGYTSAAAYNEFVTVKLPRIFLGIVVLAAVLVGIFKIRKRKGK